MLRLRVITGLLLALGAVGSIIWLDGLGFALLFAAVASLAVYEWAGLLGWSTPWRGAYIVVYFLLLSALYVMPALQPISLALTAGVWLLALVAVLLYPAGAALYRSSLLMAPLGLLLMTGAWSGLVTIRGQIDGEFWLIWVIALVALADIGAYFAGRAFGRRALAPAVSPGKTWEGVLGGQVLSLLVCGSIVGLWQGDAALWLVIIVALSALSVFGDLFESVLKRATGVKDSGNILPGHGGVLDRIDAIIAVVPVFALWLHWTART